MEIHSTSMVIKFYGDDEGRMSKSLPWGTGIKMKKELRNPVLH